jgi:photosystem II stability/assembly factor-like uncharacterized protein
MRRFLILGIISLPFFFSCKKHNGDSSNNPVDTLATGWKKIVLSEPAQLVDIFFVSNTGFTISASTIFKSVDGGTNWSRITPLAPNLQNIGMGSELNAIFISAPSKIISTHNGGTSFDSVTIDDNTLTDVFFVSSSVAYAAGKSIWKTIDGGLNWTKLHEFTATGGYKSLFFLNEQTGWVIRSEGLYRTTNGGVDWQLVITTGFNFSNSGSVFFLNTSNGYIADELSIGKTINGGALWSKVFNGTPTYHDIHFVTDNVGYVTDGQHIYKTVNGGTTWTTEVALSSSLILELHFTDVNHGWACGSEGIVLKFNQ